MTDFLIAPPASDGYGWTMTDSERLRARLAEVAARRRADQNPPAPLGPLLTDNIAALARRHMTNPERFNFATDEDMDRKEAEIRQEMAERRAEIMLGHLPAKYRAATYPGTDEGQAAWRWARDYRAGKRDNLVILGNLGTGKTWTAAAIARDLLTGDKPVPVSFITVADMLATLRTARPGLDTDMAQFSLAPVLVLDDLGLEYQTDWTREQLYRLAHARSHSGRPTIVTSNLTGDEIKSTYEGRTVQRLFGGASLIQIPGESRRTLPF